MKREVKFLCKLMLLIPLSFLFTSCDEDENEMEAWEVEINQVKAVTALTTIQISYLDSCKLKSS